MLVYLHNAQLHIFKLYPVLAPENVGKNDNAVIVTKIIACIKKPHRCQ